MAYEEHDGSEHFGARSPRSQHGDPTVDAEPGEDRYEESDEWFGDDDFDLDLVAPPPPYAQHPSPGPGPAAPLPPAPPPPGERPRTDVAGHGPVSRPGPLDPQPAAAAPRPPEPFPEEPPSPTHPGPGPSVPSAAPDPGLPHPGARPDAEAAPSAASRPAGPDDAPQRGPADQDAAAEPPVPSARSRFGRNRPQLRQLLEESQQRSAPPPPPAEDVPEPEPLPPLDLPEFLPSASPGPEPSAPAWPAGPSGPHPSVRAEERPEPRPADPVPHRAAPASPPPPPASPPQPPARRAVTPPGGVAPPVVTPGREWSGGHRTGTASGWRRAVRSLTFGLVTPGESRAGRRRQELISRACTHVVGGHHRVAVLSLKGGVGKTTTTAALGSTLASLRGDRVLAVDANPDRGTLSDKLHLETPTTIRDLLNEKDTISRYADIRAFTSQAPSRLEVLASDQDPAVSEALSEYDYREVSRIVEHFYSITLTDCGTGLLHSAMRGVLGLADQIIVVSTPSVDGARSASATLDWLDAHDYGPLVRGAVVVLSMVRRNHRSNVDLQRLEEHFASRCRAVVRVPWDPHLEEGAEIHLDRLHPTTRDAYLELAATVGEAFAWPR